MANQKFKTKVQADAGVQLTAESASKALQLDGSGNVQSSAVTTTELGYVSGVTSAIQTQFTGKISATEKGAANGVATLDSNSLIPITQIPPAALERLVVVADQTARFALTTATVQNGDTVKQTDTNVMYFVIDDTNLGNAAGYSIYSAGTAVNFSGSLSGDVTGTQSATAISNTTVTGKLLTGFVSGAGTVSATDSILTAIDKLDGNIAAISGTTSPGDINQTSFAAANNVSSAANVTGLAFAAGSVRSFKAQVSVSIVATGSLYEVFELTGIQTGTGFVIATSSVGDDSGVVFSITSAGQVQYTSTNVTGFTSDTMKFRAKVTNV